MIERDIFILALHQRDPAKRSALLHRHCAGDEGLRARVEELLREQEQLGSFLEHTPADLFATVDDPIQESPGMAIEHYKLLEQIGEGGFGVVFMAEQQEPIRRKVALKVLKPGMDTQQVVTRFEAERQALALMDHPNIAHVFDGGETASGRPYFAMELVRGVPITDFCDQNRLSIRQRLELFVDVCQAVQHAHQKGIIHRDLKPSNVMVTLHDGAPVVKVIDFGIAKATGQQLTDKTLFTHFAQMIGTPLYMSPEQAGMSGLDVDTRSDIYSLGVVLYELLTGTTPFDKERLKEMGYDELRRIIREEEPPRPSTRISTLGQAATTVCTQRQSEPKQLSRLIRVELDWIVMKALEKDRNRRYETASAFGADVQRYLHDEPVQACPPSVWYRLRKFARRHKGPMLAASLVVLALAGGSIGTTVGLIQAEKAHQREAGLRRTAEDNEKMAKEREAETRAALDFLERHVLAAARPEGQEGGLGRAVTLRKALEAALPFVDQSFSQQPLIEARLRLTLATSFGNLGEAKLAADQAGRARTIYSKQLGPDHPDTLASMHNLANCYDGLGRRTDALKLREETLALLKAKLGPDHPQTLLAMNNLALSYAALGRQADALKLQEETLALKKAKLGPDHPSTLGSMNNLALAYSGLGRHDEALKLGQETLALYKAKLGPDHRFTLGSMDSLACIYNNLGRHGEAVKLYEETLALMKVKLGPDHPMTLKCMHDLARTYSALGRHGEALKLGQETLERRKAKLGAGRPDTLFSMGDVATNLIKLKRGAEAIRVIDECLQRAAESAAASRFSYLADERLRYFEKARDAAGCRTTAELWEKLNCTDPGSFYNAARYRAVTAAVLRATDPSPATARLANAELRQAMTWLHKAVAAGYDDAEHMKVDTDLDALRGCEDFRKLLAELEAGKPTMAKESEAQTRAVLDFLERDVLAAARLEGQDGGLGRDMTLRQAVDAALPFLKNGFAEQPLIKARLRMTLGWTYWCLGEYRGAADQLEAARTLYARHRGPDHPDTLLNMNRLANSYYHLGRNTEALKLHEETLALRRAKLGPDHPDTLWSMNNVAACYFLLGRNTEALKLHEETLALRQAKLGPGHPYTLVSLNALATSYSALGRQTEALELHKKTLALMTAKLGPHHRLTLQTMACLSGSNADLGRHAEALKLGEETLTLQKAKLGPDHPDTLRSMNMLAWILATCPDVKVRNPSRAVELAKQAVERSPSGGGFWNTLGVAFYRAGDWKAAVQALKKSMELRKGGDSFDWFFLAMAHWQLGDKDQARHWYDLAVQWMDKNQPKDDELLRFRKEAAELMRMEEKSK